MNDELQKLRERVEAQQEELAEELSAERARLEVAFSQACEAKDEEIARARAEAESLREKLENVQN